MALVGTSGAGKTTTAHLLMRFWDPRSGRVLLNGIDLREYALEDVRSRVALVAQDTYLFNDTLRRNIMIAHPEASEDELLRAVQYASLDDVVAALPEGLDSRVGERGMSLSGGQRQRVAIARAFLKDAPILILDEATSHLDAINERAVRDALDRLKADRTTIVIAHRLSTIRDADLIIVLDAGGSPRPARTTACWPQAACTRNSCSISFPPPTSPLCNPRRGAGNQESPPAPLGERIETNIHTGGKKMTAEGYAHPEMLCDTEWLGEHLDDPNVRVVDCDQFMEYRRGHIRNAAAIMAPHHYVKESGYERAPKAHPLVMPQEPFTDLMMRMGIDENTTVVAYDQSASLYAARFWWVLGLYGHTNVKVLNGGWRKWFDEGRPLSIDPPSAPRHQVGTATPAGLGLHP